MQWYIACIGVFIALVAGILLYGVLYKNQMIERRVRQRLCNERREYVNRESEAIQRSLCQSQMTVYIDRELDDSHETQRREYERRGMRYHWYPEKSSELVYIDGHERSFDLVFAREVASDFCLARYPLVSLLIQQMSSNPIRETKGLRFALSRAKYDSIYRIISLIYQLLYPVVDRTTRIEQRASLHLQ